MSDEVMATPQVQELLGYRRPQDASGWCRDQGIVPLPWRDANGSRVWPGEQVREAAANRPGRGARSDLGYSQVEHARKRGEALDESDRAILRYLSRPEALLRSSNRIDLPAGVAPGARLARLERIGLVKRTWRGSERKTVVRITRRGRESASQEGDAASD